MDELEFLAWAVALELYELAGQSACSSLLALQFVDWRSRSRVGSENFLPSRVDASRVKRRALADPLDLTHDDHNVSTRRMHECCRVRPRGSPCQLLVSARSLAARLTSCSNTTTRADNDYDDLYGDLYPAETEAAPAASTSAAPSASATTAPAAASPAGSTSTSAATGAPAAIGYGGDAARPAQLPQVPTGAAMPAAGGMVHDIGIPRPQALQANALASKTADQLDEG